MSADPMSAGTAESPISMAAEFEVVVVVPVVGVVVLFSQDRFGPSPAMRIAS